MLTRLLICLLAVPLSLQNPNTLTPEERAQMEAQNAALRDDAAAAPQAAAGAGADRGAGAAAGRLGAGHGVVGRLRSRRADLPAAARRQGRSGRSCSIADGKVVRSWGKGMYTTPHAIRLDPQGNVWTTDAASSMVYKFSPEGKTLLQIEVGGQPTPCGGFCSTTDIAFAPNGHLFIADGYRNARILEYSADGKKLREWGSAGTGPGPVPPAALDPDRRATA